MFNREDYKMFEKRIKNHNIEIYKMSNDDVCDDLKNLREKCGCSECVELGPIGPNECDLDYLRECLFRELLNKNKTKKLANLRKKMMLNDYDQIEAENLIVNSIDFLFGYLHRPNFLVDCDDEKWSIEALLASISSMISFENNLNFIYFFNKYIKNLTSDAIYDQIEILKKFGWNDKFGILKEILAYDEFAEKSELLAELISDEEKRELSKLIVTTKKSETRKRL